MESDSEKENYFSLYMKKKKNESKKKGNFRSDKKSKNNCGSIEKLKEDNKKNVKILLESSERKNKNKFSLIKSYLYNFQEPENNKKSFRQDDKNMMISNNKLKNVRVNKSSLDINSQRKSYKKQKINDNIYKNEGYSDKNKSIDLKKIHNNNSNFDNRIEKLKKRIFDLMNVINNFEKDYINNPKQEKIKEQLSEINLKIISTNVQQNKINNKKKINTNRFINDYLCVTDRANYNPNKKMKINNNININEDLDICNYYDYDYDNKILTKRDNSNKKKYRPLSSKIYDKNKPIIMSMSKQTNRNKNNDNSAFMKLISSNSSSKNELNKKNKNFNKNNGKIIINKIKPNSTINKNIYKNKQDKFSKESIIFQRRINYSNFINQKMKQNIIQRNQELDLKKNMKNKSKYSYNNSNNSNGYNNMKININNNYINEDFSKENKNNSLDKKVIKLENLNIIINSNPQRDKMKNRERNEKKNQFFKNLNKNYFFSENRDIINNNGLNN